MRRSLRFAAIAIAVAVLVPSAACLTRRATGEGPWRIEQSRTPRVAIHANEVRITDARRFTWRTERDFDAAWFDTAYKDRDTVMPFLHIYTEIFSPRVCSDPRYEALLRRMRIAR